MAGWMLPVGLLRAATPASQVAWRTARFRVFVDGGMFLGPFASGLLGAAHARVLPATLSAGAVAGGVRPPAPRAPPPAGLRRPAGAGVRRSRGGGSGAAPVLGG